VINKALGKIFDKIHKEAKHRKDPAVKGIGLQLYLADHCNRGCWGCLPFSPIAKKGFADPVIIERDLKRMSELTGGGYKQLTC
jgi:hypothetical protein